MTTQSIQCKNQLIFHSFTPQKPVANPLALTSASTLKVLLTTTEQGKGKKPHQAFLRIASPTNPDLADAFPFTQKESGRPAALKLRHGPHTHARTRSELSPAPNGRNTK